MKKPLHSSLKIHDSINIKGRGTLGTSEFIFIFMVSDSQKLSKTSLPITFETLKGIALAYRSNINILKVEIEKAPIQLLENLKFYQKHVCAQLLDFLKGLHDETKSKSAF